MKNLNAILWLVGGAAVLWTLSKYTTTGAKILQTITDAGVNMIAQFEGFSAKAYNDPPGSTKWSIGFGHQIQPGEPYMTQEITVDQGRLLLAQDTANAQAAVRSVITRPLTDAQFNSLTSMAFNIGSAAFKGSTLVSLVNSGNFAGAANFMRTHYITAGGVHSDTLVARRDTEASAFA